jgi:hypothetical protein
VRRYVVAAGLAASEILALQRLVIVGAHIVWGSGDHILSLGPDLLLLVGLGTWLWWRKDLISASFMLAYAAAFECSVALTTNAPLFIYLLLFVGAFMAHAQSRYTKSDFRRLVHGLGRAYLAVSAVVALVVLGAMVWHTISGGVSWALSLDARNGIALIGLWPIFILALLVRRGSDWPTLLTLVGVAAIAWTALGWWAFIAMCRRWGRPGARISVSKTIDP